MCISYTTQIGYGTGHIEIGPGGKIDSYEDQQVRYKDSELRVFGDLSTKPQKPMGSSGSSTKKPNKKRKKVSGPVCAVVSSGPLFSGDNEPNSLIYA